MPSAFSVQRNVSAGSPASAPTLPSVVPTTCMLLPGRPTSAAMGSDFSLPRSWDHSSVHWAAVAVGRALKCQAQRLQCLVHAELLGLAARGHELGLQVAVRSGERKAHAMERAVLHKLFPIEIPPRAERIGAERREPRAQPRDHLGESGRAVHVRLLDARELGAEQREPGMPHGADEALKLRKRCPIFGPNGDRANLDDLHRVRRNRAGVAAGRFQVNDDGVHGVHLARPQVGMQQQEFDGFCSVGVEFAVFKHGRRVHPDARGRLEAGRKVSSVLHSIFLS